MITQAYPLGLKREVISAFKPLFGNEYPDTDLRNRIQIHLEWPNAREQLPAIYVTYTEGDIQNMGLGHIEFDTDESGAPIMVKHYRFDGQLNFNVLSLSALERDRIAAGLINLLAFGETIPAFDDFKEELADGDYVSMVINAEQIQTQGTNTTPVPWGNEDEMIYSQTYSVPLHGEFYSDTSGSGLIRISDVEVYPYRPGELPPF